MGNAGFQHSEAFLQWIWENLLFDFTHLETTSGKKLELLNPGILNTTDGPDFQQASVVVDGIRWHGDIELHLQSSDWKNHGHHRDRNFNTVILHVVVEPNPKMVSTENQHTPFTLNLLPYLHKPLHQFLNGYQRSGQLACSSGLHFISEDAFYKQIDKAHTEYFEKKSDDFLAHYDPNLLPSKAWIRALILSIWDGLGISKNREAMVSTAQKLFKKWDGTNPEKGYKLAKEIAGLTNKANNSTIVWNYKAVRPANHPDNRIREAVWLSSAILTVPFAEFLSAESPTYWDSLLEEASLRNTNRFKILYGTVFLPSLYMLGKLFAAHAVSDSALAAWKRLQTPIPNSLHKKFNPLQLQNKNYQKKLGTVHQLKAYCGPGKCSECFVLKNAIRS